MVFNIDAAQQQNNDSAALMHAFAQVRQTCNMQVGDERTHARTRHCLQVVSTVESFTATTLWPFVTMSADNTTTSSSIRQQFIAALMPFKMNTFTCNDDAIIFDDKSAFGLFAASYALVHRWYYSSE